MCVELAPVIRQNVPRDAGTLSIRRSLRQESMGARRRREATWYCVRPGSPHPFPLTSLRVHLHEQFTARLSISSLHRHCDSLWRLS